MKNVIKWLKGLFSNLQRLKNKLIPISVKIVDIIKKAIDSGTLETIKDDLTLMLPTWGKVGIDRLYNFLKQHIPEYAVELKIINATNLSEKTEEAQKQALEALSKTFGDTWAEYMSGSAGKIAEFLSDGEIDPTEGKILGKDYYDNYIKNK